MKVSTRLKISALLPVVLSCIISLILVEGAKRLELVTNRLAAADRVLRQVFDVNAETLRYVLAPSVAGAKHWRDAHAELGAILGSQAQIGEEDGSVLDAIRNSHSRMAVIFEKLSAANDGSSPKALEDSATARRMLDQLWRESQATAVGALTLAANAYARVAAIQRVSYYIVIGLSSVLAAVIAFFVYFLERSVSRGLGAVHAGMNAVAQGDYQHEIKLKGKDELTDLADGFNFMTAELRNSRQAIREEMDEREKASQSLRDANQQLADTLTRLKRAQGDIVNRENSLALHYVADRMVREMSDAILAASKEAKSLGADPGVLKDSEHAQNRLAALERNLSAAENVVSRLAADFSLREGGDPQPVDLNHLLEAAARDVAPEIETRLRQDGLRIEIHKEFGVVPPLVSREGDLRIAFVNLFRNAVEAMEKSAAIRIVSTLEGGQAIVRIMDSGVGMDASVSMRCMEPFFSTKAADHRGLGLPVARAAVERCGGSLQLVSEPGKGTVATLSLPLTPAVQAGVPAGSVARATAVRRVLVVDDEPWTRKFVQSCLSGAGYDVAVAVSGRDALQMVLERPCDLAILDLALPDMRGDELAGELKHHTPDLRIVMLTGFGLSMENQAMPVGVDCVLAKPTSRVELLDTVSRLCGA